MGRVWQNLRVLETVGSACGEMGVCRTVATDRNEKPLGTMHQTANYLKRF
jgi:hypothetical protein